MFQTRSIFFSWPLYDLHCSRPERCMISGAWSQDGLLPLLCKRSDAGRVTLAPPAPTGFFLDSTAMAEQQQFYLLLGNLMNPDNNVRKQSEVLIIFA